jgi:hypothetical protein
MFFDKLWVRIKGGLLTFRDDFAGAQEIREKGELLLQKLESRLKDLTKGNQGPDSSEAQSEEYSEKEAQASSSLQDIEREWDELLKLREERKQDSEKSETTPTNPRTLG